MTRATTIGAALLTMLVPLAGCENAPDVFSNWDEREAASFEGEARETRANVEMAAMSHYWPGPADIERAVTPVRVSVVNRSDRPVEVRYENFALVAADGSTYEALPPNTVGGARIGYRNPEARSTSADDTDAIPFNDESVTYHFASDEPFATYDSLYPGPEDGDGMSLAEGVVAPGEKAEGWLFFEKVPGRHERAHLRADLEYAHTGETFAQLELPLTVEG